MSTHPLPDARASAISKSLHDHWRFFFAEGVGLSVLGLAAIIVPAFSSLVATDFLGWLLFIAGLAGLVSTLGVRGAPGFGWSLLSAVVAAIAGVMLLWNPFQGLVTLTYVLTAFFIIDGLVTIILAVVYRRELSQKWEWMMANGVVDLVLAAIVISGMPSTLFWALGLIVGIDLVFGGTALIAIALTARDRA